MSDIKTRNQLITMFVNKGYTQNQAIGIVANLQAESGFRTKAHGDRGLVAGGSHGLAQWNGDRLKKLQNMYGNNWHRLENQVDYIDWELKNTESKAGEALRKANSIEEATRVFTTMYERPANMSQKAKDRIGVALGYKDIIPEDYVYEGNNYSNSNKESDYAMTNTILGLEARGGSMSEVPELTEEQKTDFAKLDIIQSQLNELLKLQQPTQQLQMSSPQVAQNEMVLEPETFEYLKNSNLFTLQNENI